MSSSYLEKKAREAIKSTKGNRQLATHLLQHWAESDPRLLGALIRPILRTLCLMAIDRTMLRERRARIPLPEQPEEPTAATSGEDAALEALTGRTQYSLTSTRAPAKRPEKGSKRHERSIESLVSAFKSKKK